MKRNYSEEYRRVYREAKELSMETMTAKDRCLYLSFTKYGKNVFKKLNQKKHMKTQC